MARGSKGAKRNNKMRFGTPKAGTVLHGELPILTRNEARAERKAMLDARNAARSHAHTPNVGASRYESGLGLHVIRRLPDTWTDSKGVVHKRRGNKHLSATEGAIALVDTTHFAKDRVSMTSTIVRHTERQRRVKGMWVNARYDDRSVAMKAIENLIYVATSVIDDPDHKDRRRLTNPARAMTYEEALRIMCWVNFDARPHARLDWAKIDPDRLLRWVNSHKR